MQKDFDMLNKIYQNAEMGRDGITHMIKATEDTNFRKTLENQLQEYQCVIDTAEQLLQEQGQKPAPANPMAKTSASVMSGMKTFRDKSPSHLADMMIQGSTMGVTDITKQIKSYNGNDQKVIDLSNKLLQTEQANIEEMKKFL